MGDSMITEGGRTHRGSRPLPLRVDPVEHADEIVRFQRRIVVGPLDTDCHVWSGGLSDDGYGVFRITRGGVRHVVRTSRYALALSLNGSVLEPHIHALHECDNPICVRITSAEDFVRGSGVHLVGGDRRDNMRRMARMRRGGGRRAILTRDAGAVSRAERSRALRAAVVDGWDAELVAAALLGAGQPTLW
ncbi:hypothetical protein [Mycolicibacterium aromaticivorans]|uniref:hypothetical protein n=1 Tax=Mycolicibacterium aromaticivorans TaxID=318425 RepID=UPI001ED9B3A1|nr:hypothetical protein [Mycolicibacterium aromaticivorans]